MLSRRKLFGFLAAAPVGAVAAIRTASPQAASFTLGGSQGVARITIGGSNIADGHITADRVSVLDADLGTYTARADLYAVKLTPEGTWAGFDVIEQRG